MLVGGKKMLDLNIKHYVSGFKYIPSYYRFHEGQIMPLLRTGAAHAGPGLFWEGLHL